MDPRRNPYAPGAGSRPPQLAGRDQVLENAEISLVRTKSGRHAKCMLMLGLRGVGKTVLLNRIQEIAEGEHYRSIYIEAPEGRRLPELLVPPLRRMLRRLDRGENVQHYARTAFSALRAFASTFKVSYADIDVGMTVAKGTADSGDIQTDLPDLFIAIAEAAREAESAAVLLIDEVQYLEQDDLAAIIVAIHHINQKGLPFIFFGAGLPQIAALVGEAKSYAERLFEFIAIEPLEKDDAISALREPARREGVDYEQAALDEIVATTRGYPYFLQEWGKNVWDIASHSPITLDDAKQATVHAVRDLDQGFFRVRVDRLTPKERRYLRAMAGLGAGPHRSGDIAREYGANVTAVAPLRQALIRKGMIYSPEHGETAFTVPMFDEFMRRHMPDFTHE